jgi:dihydropteroate synthase
MVKKFTLKWADHVLEMGGRPLVMGIVNVTPDSFSDGGKYLSAKAAVDHGMEMFHQGAHILDIGGESTRPFSDPVTEQEQIDRVIPVIKELSKAVQVPISIDTTSAIVAKEALDAGASIINDISALRMDKAMGRLAAESGVPLILMHMKGTPKDMQLSPAYDDLIGEIKSFFQTTINLALSEGVQRSQLILDPGIGFGKTERHNLALISQVDQFFALDLPILIGHSRKAFIRKTVKQTDQEDIAPNHPVVETGTQAVVSALAIKGVHIIRVHNVANTIATIKMIDALKNSANE